MKVTLLNQINEFNFDYATFNYGNGQMVIELTDIYVEQKDGGRKKLVVGQPQEYPDDFNVTGGYNIHISGWTGSYTFEFDCNDLLNKHLYVLIASIFYMFCFHLSSLRQIQVRMRLNFVGL